MQILAQPRAIRLAPEELLEPMADRALLFGVGRSIAQPVECLDDPHGRATGPEELAGGRGSEADFEIAKMYRFQSGIGVDDDLGGDRVGEAKVVGGSHAVDQDAYLIAAGDRLDHLAWISGIRRLGEAVEIRLVI